jgi:hypothetical protein
MAKANRVHSTPLLNSSSIHGTNPPPNQHAESVDSFSHQPAIGDLRTDVASVSPASPSRGYRAASPCWALLLQRCRSPARRHPRPIQLSR